MKRNEISERRPATAAAHACLQCRKVKMKCHKQLQDAKCTRCSRKSLQCDFLGHRRGRKQGFKLNRSYAQAAGVVEIAAEHLGPTFEPTVQPGVPPDHTNCEPGVPLNSYELEHASEASRPASQPVLQVAGTRTSHQEFCTPSIGFRPADVLSRRALRGTFSLRNVLSTQYESRSDPATQTISNEDPIDKGLLNLHVAASLFEGFMKHLNPFVSQLDPFLHTLEYVRRKSSFLFVAILAAASKSLHESLYPSLHSHAELLYSESFRRGWKSTEVIQAILILTYWKKPDDSRAWLSVGYAIRMAVELDWHQLGNDNRKAPTESSELNAREFRNVERTWLVLFVYDRSISLQTGKPWMIDRSKFIESVNDWYLHSLAITNDRLLCAFVSLRLITSAHVDTMASQLIIHQRQQALQYRSLLRLLDRHIEEWGKLWSEQPVSDGEDCHAFLISFYGSYARLLLFTSSLRASLRLKDVSTSVDTEAIWKSCLSALDMLRLVSIASTSPLLYFAQDSVHVMIAYATVFLIKLLVSAPEYIQHEMELPAMNNIRDAAKTFAEQQAPPNTSCALQAIFLHNATREYEALKSRQRQARDQQRDSIATFASNSNPSQEITGPIAALDDTFSGGAPPIQRDSAVPTFDNQNIQSLTLQELTLPDLDFADDEMWALVFADAGFNVDEGTFLLPA